MVWVLLIYLAAALSLVAVVLYILKLEWDLHKDYCARMGESPYPWD